MAGLIHFESTGYGRRLAEGGAVTVAQAKERISGVPALAVRALEAGDWEGFNRVYRRSRKLRVDLGRHAFGGAGRTEVCLLVSYGSAVLGAIRLPEGSAAETRDRRPAAALAALGRTLRGPSATASPGATVSTRAASGRRRGRGGARQTR